MNSSEQAETLSLWWRRSVVFIVVACFAVLLWVAFRAYSDAPPVPLKVIDTSGNTLFSGNDIMSGQEVFLKHGLMENGSIWGHGAYIGPDFSAEYLHTLAMDTTGLLAHQYFQRDAPGLNESQKTMVQALVHDVLKENRYDPARRILVFSAPEAFSYEHQQGKWKAYFAESVGNRGLLPKAISDSKDVKELTAFFAWAAWASAANRPGKSYSYTNNFPYDPVAGNNPDANTFLWSALSLIALLAGTAAVLFSFGKFGYLGWKGKGEHVHPGMLSGIMNQAQKATIKYFVAATLLFLAQTLVGGATAHFRADPSSFYGLNLAYYLPSNILRTWHLQLAVFWIVTAWIGGGLFLASSLGERETKSQRIMIHVLFLVLIVIVLGSLLGEMFGVRQLLGEAWFWLGHQGWEYLELGRAWQFLLAVGLLIWWILVYRIIRSAFNDPAKSEIAKLFLMAALTIPLFYVPAMFFTGKTNFTVVDNWRFWIIHLWVEGFFELFATVMVAVLFYRLDMVSRQTATRIIYLDAILFLGSGIIGTGHHWYWTGQSQTNMALSAIFSAMEVVPLTLLTLDAWDFIRLGHGKCDVCGKELIVPHRWTFLFLIAVGFWNFVGAGIFGFLINLPIVSYFEAGTNLTPNHGHAALMGVFGMLGVAYIVFGLRQTSTERQWADIEKYVRVSFFGLNVGLALMVALSLFPSGVMQFVDVLNNGYWHARNPAFLNVPAMHLLEWLRLPADLIFIGLGVIPLVIAALRTFVRKDIQTTLVAGDRFAPREVGGP
ncbi:MAG TPA: cbb3-type cytochrome c oxidase subunit I [Syntrophorhabdaceae bacterium]|nr:cbb3-type cytochrome c oxidase subunit I [Syntrophorhabdaceae bacterium]